MNTHAKISELLQQSGIQPSAQRVAIAQHVLHMERHPTADEVLTEVRRRFPMVSRATVYNTLKLFVNKGLLASQQFADGVTVYDANVERHHHFIDEETGEVFDVPWDAVKVDHPERFENFEVDSWMVILRGRRRPGC